MTTFPITPLPAKITSAKLLSGGDAQVKQTAAGTEISVPVADRQEIDTIIVLTVDRPAMDIPVLSESQPAQK